MMRRYSQNQRPKSSDDELREAFNNGDSVIDFSEIKQTMHFLGEAVTDDEVRQMIKEADLDKNGSIDFREFVFVVNNNMSV
ncbi:calmodulin [Schistosoma bovis]|uniref:Calmodulin n=1 Tax=Schistosoma bovis TaxID=6184 RepID=A0A430Q359_SCHBO|nr:calmodulin [Schistosoma bovis]